LTAVRLFEEAASRFPDSPAIDLGDRVVAYRELQRLVREVSHRLATLHLPAHSRIALVGVRRLETYAAYLAILRSGHTVMPLGPGNPLTFQLAVVAAARPAAAFVGETEPELAAALNGLGVKVLDPSAAMAGRGDDGLDDASEASTTAYLLFTSGSTGKPKGVPISHTNLSAYLAEVVPRFDLGPGARLSQTFALTFDPSVFDIVATLTSGSCLVVPRGQELLNPTAYANSRGLTHWYSVPSLISFAKRVGAISAGSMPALRHSMFIGEPLHRDLARAWLDATPNAHLHNVYGPTELTISCAEHQASREELAEPADPANDTVPIGSVYPGLEWLLREDDRVVEGEGELCVRGPQRFGGYLDPHDNGGRFVRAAGGGLVALRSGEVPIAADWYCTGDRVRRVSTSDGATELLHLGRIDRQVKVSGYRIELGHVEGSVRSMPGIADAAVVTAPDGAGRLSMIAFVAGDPSAVELLPKALPSVIPGYMVPARFVWVDTLPLNTSGKIDYPRLHAEAGRLLDG
jgi:amino acid adenylation domain-containing protein